MTLDGPTHEVELKFKVEDLNSLLTQLLDRGAKELGTVTQTDEYWNHPDRDFQSTDEAFRIRCVENARSPLIQMTYKGPKLDGVAKSRREIELDFDRDTQLLHVREMLEILGFHPLVTVKKSRCNLSVTHHRHEITVGLDEVEKLGSFVELEMLCQQDQVKGAELALLEFSNIIGLKLPIRASYLALLLGQPSS